MTKLIENYRSYSPPQLNCFDLVSWLSWAAQTVKPVVPDLSCTRWDNVSNNLATKVQHSVDEDPVVSLGAGGDQFVLGERSDIKLDAWPHSQIKYILIL